MWDILFNKSEGFFFREPISSLTFSEHKLEEYDIDNLNKIGFGEELSKVFIE